MKRKSDEELNVPMAAMIDVTFLLLAYFLMTIKIELPEAHLAINLPAPAVEKNDNRPPPQLLEIHVLYGRYLLMGTKNVSLDALEETLLSIAAFDPEQTVIIKVSQEAEQRELMRLLDRCRKSGLMKLNVLTLRY